MDPHPYPNATDPDLVHDDDDLDDDLAVQLKNKLMLAQYTGTSDQMHNGGLLHADDDTISALRDKLADDLSDTVAGTMNSPERSSRSRLEDYRLANAADPDDSESSRRQLTSAQGVHAPAQLNNKLMTEISCFSTARNLQISQATVTCPVGCGIGGDIWGTNIYTDDSSICKASLHATGRDGGSFFITMETGEPSYAGSFQNGVSSSPREQWDRSFAVSMEAVEQLNCFSGANTGILGTTDEWGHILVQCPSGCQEYPEQDVWGFGSYTDDSSVCKAALQYTGSDGAAFLVTIWPGQADYLSNDKYGVTSLAQTAWTRSFSVKLAANVSAAVLELQNEVETVTETPTVLPTLMPTRMPTVEKCFNGTHGCDLSSTYCAKSGYLMYNWSDSFSCVCLQGFQPHPNNQFVCLPIPPTNAPSTNDPAAFTMRPTKSPAAIPTAQPTHVPTSRPCEDGSHGCDSLTTRCTRAGAAHEFVCACLEGFIPSNHPSGRFCTATMSPTPVSSQVPSVSPTTWPTTVYRCECAEGFVPLNGSSTSCQAVPTMQPTQANGPTQIPTARPSAPPTTVGEAIPHLVEDGEYNPREVAQKLAALDQGHGTAAQAAELKFEIKEHKEEQEQADGAAPQANDAVVSLPSPMVADEVDAEGIVRVREGNLEWYKVTVDLAGIEVDLFDQSEQMKFKMALGSCLSLHPEDVALVVLPRNTLIGGITVTAMIGVPEWAVPDVDEKLNLESHPTVNAIFAVDNAPESGIGSHAFDSITEMLSDALAASGATQSAIDGEVSSEKIQDGTSFAAIFGPGEMAQMAQALTSAGYKGPMTSIGEGQARKEGLAVGYISAAIGAGVFMLVLMVVIGARMTRSGSSASGAASRERTGDSPPSLLPSLGGKVQLNVETVGMCLTASAVSDLI
jgi:hypothetical protein